MVKDDHYSPLVQDIFRKYGSEGWTIRAIVGWLNSRLDRYPNPNSAAGRWNIGWVCRMLRMSVYVGEIVYGKKKSGHYDHCDGPLLRSGEGECGPARHEALIERPLWEAVQARLANEEPRRATVTRKGRRPRPAQRHPRLPLLWWPPARPAQGPPGARVEPVRVRGARAQAVGLPRAGLFHARGGRGGAA